MSLLSTIGMAASLVGIGANLVNDYVNERKMEEMIDEKIDQALAAREKKEEET